MTVRYSSVGETTVEVPAWVEDAKTETDATGEASETSEANATNETDGADVTDGTSGG